MEDGTVCGYDVRIVASMSASGTPGKNDKTVFMIHAHDKAVCTVSYNMTVPHVRTNVHLTGLYLLYNPFLKLKQACILLSCRCWLQALRIRW